MVVNLEYKNKYMLDLAVDVQLEAHKPAAMSVNVLDDVIVPRLPCQVNSGFIDTGIVSFVSKQYIYHFK
jgi:hypothetical protein